MKAYSYIRWSSDPQTKGDSLNRQLERTREVCREKGWQLEERFRDPATSGYSGRNLQKGALGEFIKAVEAGVIETPCVLVVEALDRLTRLRVRDARALFEKLLSLNVRICTAHNRKVYDESSLDNPIDLLISLMELSASHAYAAELGRKISAAWTRKKEEAKKGKLLTARVPAWIIVDKTLNRERPFRIDKERAAIIERIFKAYASGIGTRLICLKLNKEKVPNFGPGRGWSETSVRRYLTSPSVIGHLQPCKYISAIKRIPTGLSIENYFPKIIDKALYYRVQERIHGNKTPRGARKHCYNLFSGLAFCAKCGWVMMVKTGAHIGKKSDKGKRHVWLVCSKAWRGQGCKYVTIRLEPFERGLLTGLSINLLMKAEKQEAPATSAEQLQAELADVQARLAQGKQLLQQALSKTLADVCATLEKQAEDLKAQIALAPEHNPARKHWEHMPNTLEGRQRVQGLLRDVVKRIEIDAKNISAKVELLNGGGFTAQWDENYKYGCLLNGVWQPYLDDILFWKGPQNWKIGQQSLQLVENETPISLGVPNFGAAPNKRVILMRDGETITDAELKRLGLSTKALKRNKGVS